MHLVAGSAALIKSSQMSRIMRGERITSYLKSFDILSELQVYLFDERMSFWAFEMIFFDFDII